MWLFNVFLLNHFNFDRQPNTMSIRRQSIVAGIAGLLLAAAVVGVLAYSMSPGPGSNNSGTFSIAVTDPPTAPAGVTAAYLTYADVQIHVSHAGNESGWYTIASSGALELFSLVNVSQTIGTVPVPTGEYNMVKFNVTSATVTYDGKNYTAFVPSGEFRAAISGGVSVSTASKSGVLLDLTPRIVDIGSSSLHEFIISPAVHVFVFPHGELTDNEMRVGTRTSLSGSAMAWFGAAHSEDHSNDLNITAVSISAGALSFTVKNTGNESVLLRAAFVSSEGRSSEIASTMSMATFLIAQNGSLIPFHGYMGAMMEGSGDDSVAMSLGYLLAANSSATFTYSGLIVFNAPACSESQPPCMTPAIMTQGVVAGQLYAISVIGDGNSATTTVTAT